MKHGQKFIILTSLVAALFILSLFSGITAAQMPAEKNENKVKFESTGKLFEDAKAQFENALKQFNAKKDSTSKADLVEKTRDYLEKAIDHVISYLDNVKSRAEQPENKGLFSFDVSKNTDAHAAELQKLRTKVQLDNTTAELSVDNKELKDIYARIRLETRYDFDILLDNSIGKFLAQSDNVSARLNIQIQNLKTKGKDTSNLEAISANFTNLMQQAAADQKNTESLLAVHTGFDNSGMVINNTDAQAFLKQVDDSQRETIKILKTSGRQLQVFVRDYRILSEGSNVTGQRGNQGNLRNGRTNQGNGRNGTTMVMGTGTLIANGSGRAVIEGNVTVNLSSGTGINGSMMVSSNAVVTTDAGTNQTLGNGMVKYQGFNSATITGNNIRVGISGNNINLTASGTGAAILNGNGTYSTTNTFGVSGEWKKET